MVDQSSYIFLKNIQIGYYYNSTGFVLDWGFDYYWQQGVRRTWFKGQSSILSRVASTNVTAASYWDIYQSGTYSINTKSTDSPANIVDGWTSYA